MTYSLSLDTLVRLTHPDWFEAFSENVRLIKEGQQPGWIKRAMRAEFLLENAQGLTFELYQKFKEEVLGIDIKKNHGFMSLLYLDKNAVCRDLDQWWRDNIVEIAECSDNPTIQACLYQMNNE